MKEEREEGEHRGSRRKDGERREEVERKRDREHDDKDRHRDRDDRCWCPPLAPTDLLLDTSIHTKHRKTRTGLVTLDTETKSVGMNM